MIMEKENKRIIYEASIINLLYRTEQKKFSLNNKFRKYHSLALEWFTETILDFSYAVDFRGETFEEYINYVASLDLKPDQLSAIEDARKYPYFKKIMGEAALQQKGKLEQVLGCEIPTDGIKFLGRKNSRIPIKTEEQINLEFSIYADKLTRLFRIGALTEEQYDRYMLNLNYIYDYFISTSRGEMLPFKKVTNKQYDKIIDRSERSGLPIDIQLERDAKKYMLKYDEIQEFADQGRGR